jgi:2-deoxy-D-gluconate 3-dehydrogenase
MDIIPNSRLLDLSGKTAIVTGGAGGIGLGITRRLAEAGANVAIANRSEADAAKAVTELSAKGYKVKYVKTDVANESDVQVLIRETVASFGSLDIFVNNAGIFPMNPLATMTSADFDKVISTNLKAVFLTTKYASEQMKKQGKGGKIINITSIDALHPSMVGLAHYDSSKHGVWGFTKNVALELAPFNIQINCIAPGGVATPGVAKMSGGAPADPKITEAFLATLPMKRMGDIDEIGKVALFMASDMASYMTGTQVVVDGGALIT